MIKHYNIICHSVCVKYSLRDLLFDINKTLQSSDIRHIQSMMSALPLASARLSKL